MRDWSEGSEEWSTPSCKLVTAILTLVRSVAGVCGESAGVMIIYYVLTRTHVAGNMLRAGKGGLADGALVVASHLLLS